MIDLNALPLPALFGELTKDGSLGRLLAAAREEDLSSTGDVTTQSIVPQDARASARLVAREPGIVAGLAAVMHVLSAFEVDVRWNATTSDGGACANGDVLGTLEGSLAGILIAERTLLNLVARLTGVATMTRRYVDAAHGTNALICDTRKTAPAMRSMQKYAVRCGGGWLHRMGLFDAALYKDNHLANIPPAELAARLEAAIRAAREANELRFVEVEVDSLEQLERVLAVPAGLIDMVLLDNMPPDDMRKAVALRDNTLPRPGLLLEASGGITLENVRAVGETGVDRISIGAITHAAPALDLSLEVVA